MAVVDYKGCPVRREDATFLEDHQWLNDTCIGLGLKLTEDDLGERSDILFVDPAVVSCLMLQCDDEEELAELGTGMGIRQQAAIFLPINDNTSFFSQSAHWSLLMYLSKEHSFQHFDSAGGHNNRRAEDVAVQFVALLRTIGLPLAAPIAGKRGWGGGGGGGESSNDGAEESGPEMPRVCHVASPQQNNSYDCGIYVLATAASLAQALPAVAAVAAAGEQSDRSSEATVRPPLPPQPRWHDGLEKEVTPAAVTALRARLRDFAAGLFRTDG